ncbi:uncharacterized protein LOC123317708 [Coccinella septempunctata]|uniref:uncharacterized protein LOC123317708 n=1 Tax=Coccinella septempunctata TaxID=41139 RepID=UPI001D06B06A|nr:uncharacterized protein LOC123317708 [Coccinella septempunctata]
MSSEKVVGETICGCCRRGVVKAVKCQVKMVSDSVIVCCADNNKVGEVANDEVSNENSDGTNIKQSTSKFEITEKTTQIELMMKIIRELEDKNILMNENNSLLKYKISVMEKEILSQADKIKQLEKNLNKAQGDDRQEVERSTRTANNKIRSHQKEEGFLVQNSVGKMQQLEHAQRKKMNEVIDLGKYDKVKEGVDKSNPTTNRFADEKSEGKSNSESNEKWINVNNKRKRKYRSLRFGTCEVNDNENSFVGQERQAWFFISRVKDHVTEPMIENYIKEKTNFKDEVVEVKELTPKGKHGGTAIYIHQDVNSKRRRKLEDLSIIGQIECAAAEMCLGGKSFILLSVYRPCSATSDFDVFIAQLEKVLRVAHGFLEGRSVQTALYQFTERVLKIIEEDKLGLGLFIDLASAYDCLFRPFLLEKLERLGVRGNAKKWIASYLSGRLQRVSIVRNGREVRSDIVQSDYGVPQGSVLGPLLFLIFLIDICDLNEEILNWLTSFVDDTNVIVSGVDFEDIESKLEFIFQQIKMWFEKNKLVMNHSKTSAVLFSTSRSNKARQGGLCVDGNEVEIKDAVKFLGVFLDGHLRWSYQIDHLESKLCRVGYGLRTLSELPDDMKRLNNFKLFKEKVRDFVIELEPYSLSDFLV